MKKWLTSLSMIILGVGLCLISLAITIFVAPILLYMAPTAWVVVFGPPDHMTTPEDYAHRMIITSTDGVNIDSIEIIQSQKVYAPPTIAAVLGRYRIGDTIHIRLLSFEDRGTTFGIYPPFYETTETNQHFEATMSRFRNDANLQIAVYGKVKNRDIDRIVVIWTDQLHNEATITDNTFLLFEKWPDGVDFPDEPLQVIAYDSNEQSISEILLNWHKKN